MGMMPKIAKKPTTMNKTIAMTLILENQNSVSAKNLTERALEIKITAINNALHSQVGEPGNHCCMINPAAVNSEPNATVQVNQYKIATVKPVPGPIYLSA